MVNLLALSPDDALQYVTRFGLVRLLFRWVIDHYTVRLNVTGLCLVQSSALIPDVLTEICCESCQSFQGMLGQYLRLSCDQFLPRLFKFIFH
jgi:hypothetical protein